MNEIVEAQYELMRLYLPVQRGNLRISNLTMFNTMLYIAENGWHTIYTHLRRWAEDGGSIGCSRPCRSIG